MNDDNENVSKRLRITSFGLRSITFATLALLAGCLATPTPAAAEEGWQRPDKWQRMRLSMSKDQVLELLGKPTSQLLGYAFEYEGEVTGTGRVRGRVLFDPTNRVVHFEAPHFWHEFAGPDDPKGNSDANGQQIRRSRRTNESLWETSASSADNR